MLTISNQQQIENSKKSRNNYNNDLYFKESFDETKSKLAQIREDIQHNKISTMKCKFNMSKNHYYSDLDQKKEDKIINEKFSFFEILSNLLILLENFLGIKSEKHHKTCLKSKEFFYIPCINCCNQINIEDVSSHSDICVNVIEDFLYLEKSDIFKSTDLKLSKLRDHIKNLCERKQENINKDEHYLCILCEYLTEILCNFKFNLGFKKADKNSLNSLKKIEKNIKVIVF